MLSKQLHSQCITWTHDKKNNQIVDFIAKLENLTDRVELAQDMHFLKGGALSLGFSQLSQLCHDGEKAAGEGNADSVDVAAILACYTVSKQAFLDNYQQELAA